ncbi:MAG: hypothetical protein K6V36_16205, partial [Anaerolineae bacterium]|nr:hypothetical protein [Anaerolineae bacterium]
MSDRARAGKSHIAFSWALVVLLGAFTVHAALAYPIEEHAYDAATFHVYRSVVYSAARADGWLYPRWVQPINAGLGGPLFSFYPPAPYLLLDLVTTIGIAHPVAWRLLVAGAFLLLMAGGFKLALALFGRADTALVCAVSATYSPYLLQELFERGSPQGLAIALYPWLLWLLLRVAERPSGASVGPASLCWAAIILVHSVAGLVLVPILAVFVAYLACWRGGRVVIPCGAALALGVLLAACYILPFVAEARYVKLENASLVDYAQPVTNPLSLVDLLAPPAIMDTGLGNNAMGQHVSPLEALAVLVGPLLAIVAYRERRGARAVLAGGLGLWGLATIWLQTRMSNWLWAGLPALKILQFRWRLLGVLGLLAALLLGSLLELLPWRLRGWLGAALIPICVGMQLPSLYPALLPRYASFPRAPTVADAQAAALRSGVPGLTTFGEFTPRWRQWAFTEEEAERAAAAPISNLPEGGRILADERHTGRWRVWLETPMPFDAVFYMLYYPGWAGYVDGQRRTVWPVEGPGYLALELPAGEHTVELRYEGTWVQRVGDAASVLAAVLIVLLTMLWRPTSSKPKTGLEGNGTLMYLEPRWWLVLGLVMIVAVKAAWVDPRTGWLRASSTCSAIQVAQAQCGVWFENQVHLCGYSVSARELRPGDRIQVVLYWQVERPVTDPANSFVHLLGTALNPDTNNRLWGQQDKQTPGERPLVTWVPGKLYRDVYEFRVPVGTPPGAYQIEIGWWRPDVGARLKPRIDRPVAELSVSNLDS